MIQLKDTNAYAIPVPVDAVRFKVSSGYLWDDVKDKILNYIGYSKYTILGTATKEHISFDATKVVERSNNGDYKQYKNTGVSAYISPNNSFHSLMQASGCYYENPLGKYSNFRSDIKEEDWQQAQKNTSEKWVIIKKQD